MKKGFTLIELLAVIVVLGVVLLIAIGIFTDSIDNMTTLSYKQSAYSYIHAVEKDLAMKLMDETIINDNITFLNDSYTDNTIEVKGTKPVSVNLTIENGNIVSGTMIIKNREFTINYGIIVSSTVVTPDLIDENYIVYEETTTFSDIYATYDSAVKIGTTIGTNKNQTYFNVLSYNVAGYDTSGLLKFDVSQIDMTNVASIDLYSFYYSGDIPDRQQTHPVRKMIVDWNDSSTLTNAMMDSTYTTSMTSLNTANYGYGWRKADVTNIVNFWKANPTQNYGIVIDNNRGASVAGGYWNNMLYYSLEADPDFWPRLRINYNTNKINKYINLKPVYDSAVKIGTTIGTNKNQTYFNVLSYNVAGYDTSGLLKFEMPQTSKYDYKESVLYAYYYNGDIPERQQTHPVRKMIVDWNDSSTLTNAMMDTTICDLMESIDTSSYGYGWRRSNITPITEYWESNPSLNYGIVIDSNRGVAVAGGYWNNMLYYSIEALNGNEPYIKLYIEEK